MIVVADSGSTKADWKLINNQGMYSLSTMGFNPVFHNDQLIYRTLNNAIEQKELVKQAECVHYYGSGCWDTGRKEIVAKALRRIFINAQVIVEHDLLAAARATCGNEAGIACILGTGSNSCLYNGMEVIDNVTNLAFLLGDEGSGTHLGKMLIRAYFYRELPKELEQTMEEWFPEGKDGILDNIYGKETPNVYLASFTKFLAAHKEHFFVQKLLYTAFSTFIDRNVRKYKGCNKLPIHFIGSVGYYFQDIIKFVLKERNMVVGKFIKKPIEHLVNFHTTNGN